VVNTWNSLPNWVVFTNTTNKFKSRLDKFWQNQDIMFCTELEVVVQLYMENLSKYIVL